MARATGDERNGSAPELIRVGYVSGAHGVRGAIRVRLDNPDSNLVRQMKLLTLVRDGRISQHQVASSQPAGRGTFKVTLDSISSIEEAEALSGAVVMIAVAALPPTTPREFYYFEAVGCRVVTTTGLPVGTIEEVFSNGANDVWVVRHGSAEHLVPVIEDVVKQINLGAGRIIIEAVPGLLD